MIGADLVSEVVGGTPPSELRDPATRSIWNGLPAGLTSPAPRCTALVGARVPEM
jgi:hypothetical protein